MQGLNLKATSCVKPLQHILSNACSGYSSVRTVCEVTSKMLTNLKEKPQIDNVKKYGLNKGTVKCYIFKVIKDFTLL